MQKRLNLAIDALPPRCKLIFKLIKEDGLKYKEVALLLDLSQKTIENQMTIALRKIGESIQLEVSKTYLN
jgi:RNA polymerase sigma factor (sigma-70 family)